MEMEHALPSLSKAPEVVQGDGYGKKLGRQARMYAKVTMGGREG